MVRITIEIVPFGKEEYKRIIGEIKIINTVDHPERPEFGNYKVIIIEKDTKKEIRIKDHKRSEGIWALLDKILKKHKK